MHLSKYRVTLAKKVTKYKYFSELENVFDYVPFLFCFDGSTSFFFMSSSMKPWRWKIVTAKEFFYYFENGAIFKCNAVFLMHNWWINDSSEIVTNYIFEYLKYLITVTSTVKKMYLNTWKITQKSNEYCNGVTAIVCIYGCLVRNL